MEFFNYFNPVKIHCECNYLEMIMEVLERYSNVLFVTTNGVLRRQPELAQICHKYRVNIVSNIASNPELEFLQNIKKVLSKTSAIIAVGGGSVIDSAKFLAVEGEIIANNGNLDITQTPSFLPIFAIPTTAGTSSELTKWATIWDTKSSVKYSLSHEKLYPQEAFYDSHLMLSLSKEETKNGALDTLSHCLESIWNKNANPISTSHAIKGIEIVLGTLPTLLKNLESLELRKKITLSNIHAGLAFSNTQTALAHALSYPMTMKLGIPHGLACSITLPLLFDHVCCELFEEALAMDYKERIIKLFRQIGVSIKLKDYGITKDFIEEIFTNLNPRAKNGLFDLVGVKKSILDLL